MRRYGRHDKKYLTSNPEIEIEHLCNTIEAYTTVLILILPTYRRYQKGDETSQAHVVINAHAQILHIISITKLIVYAN